MALDAVLIGPLDSSDLSPAKRRALAAECERRGLRTAMIAGDAGTEADALAERVASAVDGLGLSPAQCALITDCPAAARAARTAGLVIMAMCSSRGDRGSLRAAGARGLYNGADDLLRDLDAALRTASPGSLRLTVEAMDRLMRDALGVARAGMEAGEAPIGCVLARGDGTIIARGHNRQNATQNKTAHAEIVCFADAAGKAPLDANDLILVSSLEPCVMCTGAAMEAAVDTILFALPAPADSGSQRVACPTSPESQMPRIFGGILKPESRALFEEFLRRDPSPPQRRFVEQLLSPTPGQES